MVHGTAGSGSLGYKSYPKEGATEIAALLILDYLCTIPEERKDVVADFVVASAQRARCSVDEVRSAVIAIVMSTAAFLTCRIQVHAITGCSLDL